MKNRKKKGGNTKKDMYIKKKNVENMKRKRKRERTRELKRKLKNVSKVMCGFRLRSRR